MDAAALNALSDRLARMRGASALVGHAPAFSRALSLVPRLAEDEATVLVCGETGTGKELFARAIHYLGPRAARPFVAVNCGALPDTLLEDELFGHERGAFTDARTRRTGLLEEAQHGTLFLDEVDSLSPRGQVSLLRVLQDRTFRPLGGGRERQVDVRFIAATNAALLERVGCGAFRADLYYRLCVLSVELPPLRERREDILPLAAHFLRKNLRGGREAPRFSPAAAAALLGAPWPGNVRELENAVVRALCLASGGVIEVADLGIASVPVPTLFPSPAGLPAASPPPAAPAQPSAPPSDACGGEFQALKQRVVEAFERDYLLRTMSEHGGNVTRAARAAGKDRREFGKLLKKHRLDPRAFACR